MCLLYLMDETTDKTNKLKEIVKEDIRQILKPSENDNHELRKTLINKNNCSSNRVLEFIFNKDLQSYFKQIIGNYYIWLHIGIMTMGIYIILFSMNQLALIFVIIVLAIDAFTIVILHDCPLTMLERYYVKHSSVYWRLDALRNSGIKYSLENEYDIQLEVVINGAAMAIFKLFCIVVLQSKPFI